MTERELSSLTPDRALGELTLLAARKGALRRAVLTKCADESCKRATLSPRTIGQECMLQLEIFTSDNKAYHRNLALGDVEALVAVLANYAQINLLTDGGDCELKRAKDGHATLLRGGKLLRALNDPQATTEPTARNDRRKQYILSGDEPFLRALGISDASGRIHDKKQSKFRQINRFLELLRDVEDHLPKDGVLRVCDLCCGKSYLSFAVYHYLTAVKGREVIMECVDLKSDVIRDCNAVAERLGMQGLRFLCGDVAAFEPTDGAHVHLVVSLHACDTATDLVLGKALSWQSEVILSTPCCHHELNHTLNCPELSCIAEHSMLRQKLCDAATDAMRLKLLEAHGYRVAALELIDPDDTPKNVMLRAILREKPDTATCARALEEYRAARAFLLGGDK